MTSKVKKIFKNQLKMSKDISSQNHEIKSHDYEIFTIIITYIYTITINT